MADQFDNVAHVAPATITDLLRELGAESVVEFPDLLTHGPVATDPKRHRKARLKYWRKLYESLLVGESKGQIVGAMDRLENGYLSAEQIGSAALHAAGDGRIVIWTTPTFEDRLFLWFVFHALIAEGVPVGRIATAEPRVQLEAAEDEDVRYASLRGLEVDELAGGFEELFYPVLVYAEAGANLWETFSSVSPRQFAIAIPHTTKFFPEFAVFAEDYGRLFPIAEGERAKKVRLSEFDTDLLAQLDEEESRTGLEIIDDLFALKYAFLDDLVYLARLRAWSSADEDNPYVVCKPNEDSNDVFEQFSYRLTERGRELLDEGFEPGRKLPVFFVGDSRLYAGKKPWVRVVDGEYWWFERFDRS
jgi:hypothetical protein